MRPARPAARALASGIVLAALLTSILPALPAIAKAPVKVTGREVLPALRLGAPSPATSLAAT